MTETETETTTAAEPQSGELNGEATAGSQSANKGLKLPAIKTPNESAALQIVSPGLPQLNSNMLDTVKRSRNIEQQQKHLIERMRGSGTHSQSREPSSIVPQVLPVRPRTATGAVPPPVAESTGLTDEMNRVTTASSATAFPQVRGLKRKKAPPPLAIPDHRSVPGPEIKSAPMYFQPHQYVHPHMRPPPSVAAPYFRYPPVPRYTPYGVYPPRAPRQPRVFYLDPPVTAANNRYRVRFQQTRQSEPGVVNEGESDVVMDVFRDSHQTRAPLAAQPLSAQRATFDEEETRGSEEEDKSEEEDVEANAIEEEATPVHRPRQQVKGEIRIENDVYMYDLPLTGDYADDRKRYLSLCQTAFDEFTKSL